MQYSVGDKVVHPRFGPGRIAGVERQELIDGPRTYYVIEMVARGLIVHVPVLKAAEAGVRPAMSLSTLPQVLSTLRSRPRRLSDDHRERQEQVGAKIKTGLVMQLARVVRDLTWRGTRAHLTKNDSESLKQGQQLLAAEMALVSGGNVSDSSKLITSTLTAAVTGALS
jgi:CarD family transcriptional regulator